MVHDDKAATPSCKRLKTNNSSCETPSSPNTTPSWDALAYQSGFGNYFNSEALPDALPDLGHNPQRCPYGLYAEQLSGTAFTIPRVHNQRTWLYRILPPVVHQPFASCDTTSSESNSNADSDDIVSLEASRDITNEFVTGGIVTPQQMRWNPMPFESNSTTSVDFIQGWHTMGGAGEPTMKAGMAIHMYSANTSMEHKSFCNSDGDLLIVPQHGLLRIQTEFGKMCVSPGEMCVIQRGIRFSVYLDEPSRGYIQEVYNRHFVLPDLGPIGANGLANPQDFKHPVACYEDTETPYKLVTKFGGKMFVATMGFSPYNVVAWRGNYIPYKYDLATFSPMNAVAFDHPDPSIFTVLTCPSDEPGVAVADFVIFPPRWMVQQHTFRPPYFHRNVMTEFMGLIRGNYDAKAAGKGGFVPGAASLHSCGTAHGPDAATYAAASTQALMPHYFNGGLAFMFESTYLLKLSPYALACEQNDTLYYQCWQPLKKNFDPTQR